MPLGLAVAAYRLDAQRRAEMGKAAHKERRKATAGLLNTLSAGLAI